MLSTEQSSSTSKKATFSPTVLLVVEKAGTPGSNGSKCRYTNHSSSKSESNRSFNNTHQSPNVSEATRDSSMMLLPPSQTIGESLTALASTTATQLEDVWDEVGYTPEERASQLTDLLSEFRRLCEEKVAYEQNVADTFRQTIIDAKEEMRNTGAALKIDVDDNLLQESSEMTLTDELATLEAALEGMRAAADVAASDLCACRDQLIKHHAALGYSIDQTWCDVTSDLTNACRESFHKKVKEMEELVATRKSAIVQLLKDCQTLIKELRINTKLNELDDKIMSSLKRESNGVIGVTSMIEDSTCIGISAAALDKLTNRVGELNGEKRRRKEKLAVMGKDIGYLWETLRVPMEEQQAFADSIDGLGMDTIKKGEIELLRLCNLKSKMMGNLILEARQKIETLWDETNVSDEQRADFIAAQITDETQFSDELLADHERQIELLQIRLDQMRPILVMIDKRESILLERMEYEELQKDPDRLMGRGASMTKQLLREEKMSKRISKFLPKYTEELEKKLEEWRQESGEAFFYKGKPYLEIMKQQEEEWQAYKELQTRLKTQRMQDEMTGAEPNSRAPQRKKAASSTLGLVVLTDNTNRVRAISRGCFRAPDNKPASVGDAVFSRNNGSRPVSRGRAEAENDFGAGNRARTGNAADARTVSTGRARPLTRV